MKQLLCFAALLVAAQAASLTSEQVEKLKGYYKECVQESHAEPEMITKARNADFTEDAHLDDFFTCIFKKVGFLDEEYKLRPEVIKAKAPSDIKPEDVDKVIAACAKVQSEAKEKVAKLAYKCYLTETPVKIQLVP